MQTSSRQFGYKLSGFFLEYGPIQAEGLDGAKAEVRRRLGVSRLPQGCEIWDLAERPITRWRVDIAS